MHPLDHVDVLLRRSAETHSALQDAIRIAVATKIGRIELASVAAGFVGDTETSRKLQDLIRESLARFEEVAGNGSIWQDERTPAAGDSIVLDGGELDSASSACRHDFALNFRDRLRHMGVSAFAADVVSAASLELMSNAIEHAQSRLLPVAAFEVSAERWRFCTTDIGRGIRASLADNPEYAGLRSDADALREALKPGVSCTRISGRGQGFTFVFKALVDREATVRIRTGSVAVNWSGRGITNQLLTFLSVGQRTGLHIEVGATL